MILVLLVAVVALGVSVYDAAMSPAASVPGSKPAPTPVADARGFVLMPNGTVEVTDASARRVFQWDGARWLEQETTAAAIAQNDLP